MASARRSLDGTPARVGVVYAGYRSTHRIVTDDAYPDGTTLVPMYDLPEHDLTRFDGVVLPSVVDQSFLARESDVLEEYLEAGGVVVSFAKVDRGWLDGYRWRSHPEPARTLELTRVRDHPVLDPLTDRDLNVFEGVRGWFARGFLDAPDPADPVVVDADGRVVVSVDDETTPGTVMAWAGSDPLQRAFREHEPFPTVVSRLLEWVTTESNVPRAVPQRETRGRPR